MSNRIPSIIGTLNAIEQELPVAEWSVDGLRVWPLVRYLLGCDLANRCRLPPGGSPGSAGLERGTARALRLLREYAGWTRARIADRRNDQALDRTYGSVFLQIFPRPMLVNGSWMCPFAEPLRERLAAFDLDMLVLDLCGGIRGYPIPRYAPSRHVSFEDKLAIRLRNRRYASPADVRLPGIERLGGFLADWPGVPVPGKAAVLDLLRNIRVWSEYFDRIIERTRPRIGFVPSYFGPTAFAFLLACRRAGIPSVNLQHGYQGPWHPAFASWTVVPVGGYDLLPTYFWCWSRTDVEAIASWSSRLNTHVPILGGNPWINMWNRLRDRADSGVRLDDVGSAPGSVHILYSSPPEPRMPATILDVIRASPPSWVWWLRLHPSRQAGAAQQVRDQLREIGNVRVEIERATDTSLFELLRFVDVHVTGYSTVVLEAAAFGVPSVVFHHIGEQYFAETIAAGLAAFAPEPAAMLTAIERFSRGARTSAGEPLNLPEHEEADVMRRLLTRAGVLAAGASARSA